MAKHKFTDEDDDLLAELGVEVEPKKGTARTAREERVIAGFEEIQRFVDQHGHPPRHGEDYDIFERLYAVRLGRLRELPDCRVLLEPLDTQGLLIGMVPTSAIAPDDLDDDALLAELGVDPAQDDISELRHVRSAADKRAAEEIANRDPCLDFDQFKPLFAEVKREIAEGVRQTRPFELKAEIRPGAWFIVGGQTAYVASMGEVFSNAQGRTDARLRVIFDNGTESNLLLRSLQRSLHKDEAGRRITDPVAGPLFAGEMEDGDLESGTIYVLRSKSDNPVIAAHRDVLHKIGVTGGDVAKRVANAKIDATFLLADVEIVATYRLSNINRAKLENLIHRIFDPARLDIEIRDRFGNPVVPREWFLVPFFVIDEVVEKIKDGTIVNFGYDPKSASLVAREILSFETKSGRMVADIFDPPPSRWGLRGDPFLWGAMLQSIGKQEMPDSENGLIALIESAFAQLTGSMLPSEDSISDDDAVFLETYAHGGMSGGHISLKFWRFEALPLLKTRYHSGRDCRDD